MSIIGNIFADRNLGCRSGPRSVFMSFTSQMLGTLKIYFGFFLFTSVNTLHKYRIPVISKQRYNLYSWIVLNFVNKAFQNSYYVDLSNNSDEYPGFIITNQMRHVRKYLSDYILKHACCLSSSYRNSNHFSHMECSHDDYKVLGNLMVLQILATGAKHMNVFDDVFVFITDFIFGYSVLIFNRADSDLGRGVFAIVYSDHVPYTSVEISDGMVRLFFRYYKHFGLTKWNGIQITRDEDQETYAELTLNDFNLSKLPKDKYWKYVDLLERYHYTDKSLSNRYSTRWCDCHETDKNLQQFNHFPDDSS